LSIFVGKIQRWRLPQIAAFLPKSRVATELLIAPFAAPNLLHGGSAGLLVVRPLYHLHFLLRCAVRVRPSRFHARRSEGVCPREIIRRKADTRNWETKEEPLIDELLPLTYLVGRQFSWKGFSFLSLSEARCADRDIAARCS